MLPAPGQAAIGIECRAEDDELRALLGAINHEPTCRAVSAERAFTRALNGDCHSPVAALAVERDGGLWLRAQLLSGDGAEQMTEDKMITHPDEAAELAKSMLDRASPAIRATFGA